MEIILVEPEIPQNTGNIARTCLATQSSLVLVNPLGFSISDRQLKRAGLDYLPKMFLQRIDSLDHYLESKIGMPFYFFSTKAKRLYTEVSYEANSIFIFGSESKGLAPEIHEKYREHFCRIPMAEEVRSLNLSNAVAIVLYEAMRQQSLDKSRRRKATTSRCTPKGKYNLECDDLSSLSYASTCRGFAGSSTLTR